MKKIRLWLKSLHDAKSETLPTFHFRPKTWKIISGVLGSSPPLNLKALEVSNRHIDPLGFLEMQQGRHTPNLSPFAQKMIELFQDTAD